MSRANLGMSEWNDLRSY